MAHRSTLAAAAAIFMAAPLTAAAAIAEQPAPPPSTNSKDMALELTYNGYFLGLRVMKASIAASVAGGGYKTDAVFRTAGLAGMFKEAAITASVHGVYTGTDVQPTHFEHKNSASKKGRKIAIDWKPDDVVPTITPPFGSMGQPPATREQKLGSRDVASTILSMVIDGHDRPCDRTLPVFDGKQRYDLKMEPVSYDSVETRGFKGMAWHCNIYYTPVSGFDPDDLAPPEEYARPMQIWLADLGQGVWAPVIVRGKVSGVTVSVEAKRVRLGPSADLSAQSDGDEDSADPT